MSLSFDMMILRGRIGLRRKIILNENSAVWYNKGQHCFFDDSEDISRNEAESVKYKQMFTEEEL